MGEREKILNHLEADYKEPIRDPIWQHIYFSEFLLKIISLKPFQELNDIKQLGPAYLVYPGATHTRLSHSLGTFHIAKRIINSLVKRHIKNNLTLNGVKAFLCAALLHDLGHYPFAHSLKELAVEDHEILTAKIILEESVARIIKESLAIDPIFVAAIIDNTLQYKGDDNVVFFHRMLSGVLDPDKLDYLNRDAYYCGVPYGIQDVDFFLSEIIQNSNKGIVLAKKGLSAVENILFSKYLMYKTVYWHKTIRIATAMIKKAILLGLRKEIIINRDLYRLTDHSFKRMISKFKFKPFGLVEQVWQRQLYKVVLSTPFSQINPLHLKLEDINS